MNGDNVSICRSGGDATVRRRFACVCALVLLTGCTSMQRVDEESGGIVTAIDVGDQVRVQTPDGVRHVFIVDGIDDDRIWGEGVSFELDEITKVEVKEYDEYKTFERSVVWGAAATVALAVVIVIGLAHMPAGGL